VSYIDGALTEAANGGLEDTQPPPHWRDLFTHEQAVDDDTDDREAILAVSDIVVLDFLVQNPDRGTKNWASDGNGRLLAFDNGMSFSHLFRADHPSSRGTMPESFDIILKCPQVFYEWTYDELVNSCEQPPCVQMTSTCEASSSFCLFRRSTVERLEHLANVNHPDQRLSAQLRTLLRNEIASPVIPRRFGPDGFDALLQGLDERVLAFVQHVQQCAELHGEQSVVLMGGR
jgi:hypothetical protein